MKAQVSLLTQTRLQAVLQTMILACKAKVRMRYFKAMLGQVLGEVTRIGSVKGAPFIRFRWKMGSVRIDGNVVNAPEITRVISMQDVPTVDKITYLPSSIHMTRIFSCMKTIISFPLNIISNNPRIDIEETR
jgi:hypothetical protein